MAHFLNLLLIAAVLLAGCTTAPDVLAPPADDGGEQPPSAPASSSSTESWRAPAPAAAAPDSPVHLRGNVVTASLQPIANATVTVVGLDATHTTGADGSFDFGKLQRRIYTLQAAAAGHLPTSLTVAPGEAEAPVKVVLEAGYPVTPYNTTVHFRGILECAFEALIISPSCDSGIVALGGPGLFDQNQSFLFGADIGWKTLVIDIVFDGDAHPGLDGLRIALRGSLDPDGGGEYMQYGRWHESTSFTVRVEPGGNYTDGVEPVPLNATGFQVDVYPHGHAYHEVCGGDTCLLGAGTALNLEFDVYATLFYVESALEGFTLRTS